MTHSKEIVPRHPATHAGRKDGPKPTPLAPLNHPNHRDMTWLHRRWGSLMLLSAADHELLAAIRPNCHVCQKPVDVWTYETDGQRNVVFTVQCHGETDRMLVAFGDIPSIMLGGVTGAEAFTKPKEIEGPK